MYESDITRFIRELKQKDPKIEQSQKEGRARWWDRSLDLDEQRQFSEARVQQQGYVYQTGPKG